MEVKIMSFCSKCGAPKTDDANYCSKCGAVIEAVVQHEIPPAENIEQVYGKPAGFWIRAIALFFDSIILTIAGGVIGGVLGFLLALSVGDVGGFMPLFNLVGFVIGAAYYICMHGSYGQTLGKMLIGIKVIKINDAPLSYGTAFLRYIGRILNIITLFIGYIIVAFNRKKRGMHDFIAGTKVIYVKKSPVWAMVLGMLFLVVVPLVGIVAAVAIPKFASLSRKGKEASTKGQLGALRSALSICYGDNEGIWPETLDGMTPTYMLEIPNANPGDGTNSNRVVVEKDGRKAFNGDGMGGWWYNSGKIYGDYSGDLRVNSFAEDCRGRNINSW
ncbi:MAG: RDD family protein [Elusimicrobiota bacterium]|nr:RDD family protein [Elusimicrobiota bacterium]